MDASSTTTRSASSGRSRSYAASPPGFSSSSRCTVDASVPVSSASRLAARPVGAASTTFAFLARASSTIERTVNDLPQPGPPVSTATFRLSASRTAASCSGASSTPVRPLSHASALSHATSRNAGIRSSSVPSSRSSCADRASSARWNGTRYTAVTGSPPSGPGTFSRTTPGSSPSSGGAASSARHSMTSPVSTWSSLTASAISRSSGRKQFPWSADCDSAYCRPALTRSGLSCGMPTDWAIRSAVRNPMPHTSEASR